MEITPIADFRCPLTSKFGVPRQSGVVPDLEGTIVFRPEFRCDDALRGIEGFEYLWIIWEFSGAVRKGSEYRQDRPGWQPTVRPPRLGGNTAMGVFATRSPFRPNRLGLSSVRISSIGHGTPEGTVIRVSGADLMDGTPIYDIKPYVAYSDAHPGAVCGFTDTVQWEPLEVFFPEHLQVAAARLAGQESIAAIRGLLAQDPRPRYHHDPGRIYGMPYGHMDVRFRVEGGRVLVTDIKKI